MALRIPKPYHLKTLGMQAARITAVAAQFPNTPKALTIATNPVTTIAAIRIIF